jgi:hypothetical protein
MERNWLVHAPTVGQGYLLTLRPEKISWSAAATTKKIQVSDQTFARLKKMKQFTDGKDLVGIYAYPRTYDNLISWMLRKVEPI